MATDPITDPGVKLLLRFHRSWLLIRAKEMGIPQKGTKLQLAQKISEAESKESIRIWNAISGG